MNIQLVFALLPLLNLNAACVQDAHSKTTKEVSQQTNQPKTEPKTEKVAQDPDNPDLTEGSITFDDSVPSILEAKRVKTGHLLIKPIINDKPAGWFIFDTGAGICVLSPKTQEEFALPEAGDINATGVGGAKTLKMYRAQSFQVGPLKLTDHPAMTTDLSFLKPHLGEEIAGVIGYGVLSQCIVELDIAEGKITLHNPKTFTLAKGSWEHMKVVERIPSVHATVEGHEGWFRLDTGANSTITFHQPAVEEWKLLEDRETKDTSLGGVGGFVKAKKGTVSTLALGGVEHKDLPAEFAIEKRGNFADATHKGNIGAGLLSKYTLFLDYKQERICFVAK